MTKAFKSSARLWFGEFEAVGASPESPDATRSVVLYFEDETGERFLWGLGALIQTVGAVSLRSGQSDVEADLTFWEPEAADVVKLGARFALWYGRDIGRGVICSPLETLTIAVEGQASEG